MRSNQELLRLKEQAVALRRAGKSRREIKALLGPMSNATLNEALQGVPPPEWTRRPRAKDAVRAQARELREKGLDYEEIAAELGVSKGSVSLWVRDMPTPPHLSYEESRKRSAEGVRRYWAVEGPVREAAREAVITDAAAQIGELSDREILIAGAIAYWCEGAKGKPRRRDDRVVFINSDPGLTRFFLRFLDCAGVERDRVIYRVHAVQEIHSQTTQSEDREEEHWRGLPRVSSHRSDSQRRAVSEDRGLGTGSGECSGRAS